MSITLLDASGNSFVLDTDASGGAHVQRITGDVAATLGNGRKTVVTPGTAVPLVAASTPCKWVMVTALPANTDKVAVGAAGVLAAAGTLNGTPLNASESAVFPVANVNLLYLDARVAGEGVSFTWGV